MKKILFVALGATLLAVGCQKTEIINPVGDAMNFSTEMGKLTKAGTGDQTTLKAQNFSVWSYYAADDQHTTGDDTHKVYDKIANVEVKFGENNKWGTTEQYYWPGVGKELIFFAVSADETTIGETTFDANGDVDTNSSKVKINEDRNALEVENFEVDEAQPYVDLMVADIVKQHQGDKVVDLNFHHTLAKVEFQFKTITNEDNLVVTVNSLTVADVKTKGTFSTVQRAQTKAGDENVEGGNTEGGNTEGGNTEGGNTEGGNTEGGNTEGGSSNYSGLQTEVGLYWYDQAEPAAFSVRNSDAADEFVLTNDYQTYSTWLVIPQSISTTTVTVNYTIGEKTFDSIFNLYTSGDNALTEWAPNQHVAYRITLAPNLITFNPSVEEWDSPDNLDMIN